MSDRPPTRVSAETGDTESLLSLASEFEPTSLMPAGTEERALARLNGRRHPTAGRLALAAAGLLLFVLAVRLAIGGKSPATTGRPPDLAKVEASGAHRIHRAAGTGDASAPPDARSIAAVPAERFAAEPPQRRIERRQVVTRRIHRIRTAALQSRPRSATGGRRGSFASVHAQSAQRVWRTETVETTTLGYLAPALLSGPPDEHGSPTLTPAAIVMPVRTTSSLSISPDKPYGVNQ